MGSTESDRGDPCRRWGKCGDQAEGRRYQYGAGVGGRFIKDKLFWFFNFDQQKRDFPGVATTQSPGAFNPITVATNGPTCNNSTSAGNTLCARGITQAQADAGIGFLTGLTGIAPRRQDQTIFFPKIDWNLNKANQLTVSYNHVRTNGQNAFQTPTVVNVGAADFGESCSDRYF